MDETDNGEALPAMERAIKLAGSEEKLGEATGYSQVAINKAKKRGHCTPDMAIAIHRALEGRVPGNELCPGVWRKPEDVPVEQGTAA